MVHDGFWPGWEEQKNWDALLLRRCVVEKRAESLAPRAVASCGREKREEVLCCCLESEHGKRDGEWTHKWQGCCLLLWWKNRTEKGEQS
jgi:hypothetical protein